jgi:hypothetical protein
MVEIEKLVNIQNGNWSRNVEKDLWSPNKDLLVHRSSCQTKICWPIDLAAKQRFVVERL